MWGGLANYMCMCVNYVNFIIADRNYPTFYMLTVSGWSMMR